MAAKETRQSDTSAVAGNGDDALADFHARETTLEQMTRRVHVIGRGPAVIVMPFAPSLATPNLATRRVLEDRLARRYRRVGEAALVDVVGRQRIGIWALLARPAPAA